MDQVSGVMECLHFLSLSREEENELVRSNKKIKDSHHAIEENSPTRSGGSTYPPKLSFGDKLVREIPGAYSQAFAFLNQMEAESYSDEEIEEVREGFASISLSKETKQCMRVPLVKSLILKVFGKTVGYNFLH